MYSNIEIIYFKLAEHMIIIDRFAEAKVFIDKVFNVISSQLKILNDLLYSEKEGDKKIFVIMQKKANLFQKLYFLEISWQYFKSEDFIRDEK